MDRTAGRDWTVLWLGMMCMGTAFGNRRTLVADMSVSAKRCVVHTTMGLLRKRDVRKVAVTVTLWDLTDPTEASGAHRLVLFLARGKGWTRRTRVPSGMTLVTSFGATGVERTVDSLRTRIMTVNRTTVIIMTMNVRLTPADERS